MNSTTFFDENLIFVYKEVVQNYLPNFVKNFEYTPWVFSLLGSAVIGLSGILPLAIIPTTLDKNSSNKNEISDPADSKPLKVLLSFAVGGLLGDVFLHLLPEAWTTDFEQKNINGHPSLRSGLWVLAGVLIFTIVEKIFSGYVNADEDNPQPKCVEIANCLLRKSGGKILEGQQSVSCSASGCDIEDVPNGCYLREREKQKKEQPKKVAGYLNLMANSIDNFTHGLAVAGSFLVSFRHGILATFAILLHEIPHEVGDFAILLRSGFSRWDAARAQLLTASAGILGALVAIGGTGVTSAMEARTSWIMPFTAGGFLHIALVTVLPDLLKEEDPKESIKQLISLLFGIFLMAIMTILFES
ncbi:zinc transporter ZIP13 homolog isoform X2 [Condylostylus longicornis]|uniref:zinc transporter ZIP13 homolog isoform X2 n=1 Tax=Condylostylus longicornis TaxID=2530218 RepID=UPI00244E01BF|nr:zinc transporter ZIP13 homolog isoform X2 [Condylostylus longicornis]XP_055385047.1 zinc transporter ZIP13 homolog isoform X2 [Condylostylus longicornis]XP_055385055.1 zinc transporter ZIP13 homolog isoform X2 [Condylostylus longicornis]